MLSFSVPWTGHQTNRFALLRQADSGVAQASRPFLGAAAQSESCLNRSSFASGTTAVTLALVAAASLRCKRRPHRQEQMRVVAAKSSELTAATPLKLHLYDHCPFCVRAELVLGWLGLKCERILYNYGEGADPEKCDGNGYEPSSGPVKLTGFKMLPVLEGDVVPTTGNMVGMPESLEICSFLIASAQSNESIAPATGRGDLDAWLKRFAPVNGQLIKPRIIKMPIKDWSDPRDAAYSKWKYTSKQGFDYAAAEAATSSLLTEMATLLQELEPLLRGTTADGCPCLNVWGLSIDDVLVLPLLRNLTCVAGLEWPALARKYVEMGCKKGGVNLYSEYAC